MLLATSCETTKIQVIREIPEIDFPDFPECDGYEVIDDDTVEISSDWFIELAKFKIDYESTAEEYNRLKEAGNGDN